MIYLSGCHTKFRHPQFGIIITPRSRLHLRDHKIWAADNGRFSEPESYSDARYLRWLTAHDPAGCLFALAPDAVGDHNATFSLAWPMLPRIRALGYRAAFAAQDGWDEETTPWADFDVLFIGGTTTFKLSCHKAIIAARRHGKTVHMGRVNSFRRLRLAAALGCDSVDGTVVQFHTENYQRIARWLERLDRQPVLELVA